MNRIFTRKVEFDFNGNCIVEIPEEICNELDLHPNDIITYFQEDGHIIIRKRLDY